MERERQGACDTRAACHRTGQLLLGHCTQHRFSPAMTNQRPLQPQQSALPQQAPALLPCPAPAVALDIETGQPAPTAGQKGSSLRAAKSFQRARPVSNTREVSAEVRAVGKVHWHWGSPGTIVHQCHGHCAAGRELPHALVPWVC